MKIIVISDLHLTAPNVPLYGRNPLDQLQRCIAHINANHADADLVVLSGDLTNGGEAEAYEALAQAISRLAPPYRFMMGNHDSRQQFLRAFPAAVPQDGYMQWAGNFGDTRIILLDTLDEGHVEGRLCDRRLAWLDGALAQARRALVFLHHPPFPIGIPSLDECRLSEPESLLALLQRHGNIAHLFAGHVHRSSNGSWHGIPFTTVRSTNHQSALKLSGPHEVSFEAPTYVLILEVDDMLAVHSVEF